MRHIFVDTNIWIRVISQGRPGCEIKHLAALTQLVESKQVLLVLPEVVTLELQKGWGVFTTHVKKAVARLSENLEQAMAAQRKKWNEIEDIEKDLVPFLQAKQEEKITAARQHYKAIEHLFSLPNVIHLRLSQPILFSARKRLMAGRMPKSERNAEPGKENADTNIHSDACIVESLIEFSTHIRADDGPIDLLFCSENEGDFAIRVSNQYALHPHVREGLPTTKYFINLASMMEFHFSGAEIKEPSREEVYKELDRQLAAPEPLTRPSLCTYLGCKNRAGLFGPLCHYHAKEWIDSLAHDEQKRYEEAVYKFGEQLGPQERNILWFRTGTGGAHVFSAEQCSRIFGQPLGEMLQAEWRLAMKAHNPEWQQRFAEFFPTEPKLA